ncbi:MAG: hypothetical protein QNL04_13925 [SAR324 cluster bacterium]|nr:hypothetical protein [SAR324 cluster bacterium]
MKPKQKIETDLSKIKKYTIETIKYEWEDYVYLEKKQVVAEDCTWESAIEHTNSYLKENDFVRVYESEEDGYTCAWEFGELYSQKVKPFTEKTDYKFEEGDLVYIPHLQLAAIIVDTPWTAYEVKVEGGGIFPFRSEDQYRFWTNDMKIKDWTLDHSVFKLNQLPIPEECLQFHPSPNSTECMNLMKEFIKSVLHARRLVSNIELDELDNHSVTTGKISKAQSSVLYDLDQKKFKDWRYSRFYLDSAIRMNELMEVELKKRGVWNQAKVDKLAKKILNDTRNGIGI